MNILFTICGRAGSKGFENKNLKKLLNYPLSWYTLAAIDLLPKEEEHTYHICASSDSPELLSCLCEKSGIPVFALDRDPSLCGDLVAKAAVITDCLIKSDAHYGVQHDLVVDLDITSPLRTVEDIQNALRRKMELPEVDVVFSVVPSRRSPYFNMVVRKDDSDEYQVVIPSGFTARQQAPEVYDMNASIYVYERSCLLRNDISKNKKSIVLMEDTAVLDIDREDDLKMMEVIASYLVKEKPGFAEIYKHVTKIGK